MAEEGKFKEAASEFKEALKISPEYEEAKKNLENVRRDKVRIEGKDRDQGSGVSGRKTVVRDQWSVVGTAGWMICDNLRNLWMG